MPKLQSPFPYFGGKSRVANIIWAALGNCKYYFEPFFGSGAVLLLRPDYNPKKMETVNDKDSYISNVWRSLQHNPDEVAKYCDYPVNHCDLSARRRRLIEKEGYLKDNLIADPEWYDAKLAGYWIYSASCWIGTGLTSIGVHKIGQRPHLGNSGEGVHKIGAIPHVGNSGMGVHESSKIPHLTKGQGVQEPYNTNIYKWFRDLSERLRYVRVVCGEWHQICGGDWQDKMGICGYFFDPPYGIEDRHTSLYHHDSTNLSKDVMEWCKERGKRDTYRIVTAGYEEYRELVDNYGWTSQRWKTCGGYGNVGNGPGKKNRHRETLYFSPHCIKNTLF